MRADQPLGTRARQSINKPAKPKSFKPVKAAAKAPRTERPNLHNNATAALRVTAPAPIQQQPEVAIPAWMSKVAPAWSGVWLAGLALLVSYGTLTLLVVVALVSSGGAAATGWAAAAGVAARIWLLGHGGAASFGNMPITLFPLGFAFCYVAMFRLCVRSAANRAAARGVTNFPQFITVFTATAIYGFITMFVSSSIGQHVTENLKAGFGASIVALLAFVWAFRKDLKAANLFALDKYSWQRFLPLAFLRQILPMISAGLVAAALALLGAIASGALLVGLWAFLGREATATVVAGLSPGWVGGVLLGLAQLAYVPNWIIWAMSWLAGPGFAIGADTLFSPAAHMGGPLPALPLMAALPPESWTGVPALFSPVVFLILGACCGWVLWRRLKENTYQMLGSTVLCALVAGLGMAFLQHAAAGGIGLARLSVLGAQPWLVAAIFAAEVLVGSLVVVGSLAAGAWSAARKDRRAVGN
jgi:hypothetical protein